MARLACISVVVVSILTLNGVEPKKPNMVFIMADDLGYNDIGYHARLHDSEMKTPYLDALASEGVKLENYYVQSTCTPSRSQLMCGRYDIHTGLQHNIIQPRQKNALPLDNILLPEQLASCGYDTHMVGKWHLGDYRKEFMPQYRGFNSYFGYLNEAEDYYTHSLCDDAAGAQCGVDTRDRYGPLNSTWGEYSAFTFTTRAKEVIDGRDKSKPLFLYLAYQSVHDPLQAPDRFIEPFQHIEDTSRRTYAGMVAALDEAVMNVTEHMKNVGIFDDTVIIFSTDNGGNIYSGGNNWPLKGTKGTLWEGGIKGVGFVTGKPLQISNTESRNFMHVSDWFPTILTAADCPKIPGTQDLDGFDQWKAILQQEESPRSELLHNIDPLKGKPIPSSIRDGFDITIESAIRSGPWKLLTGDPGLDKWVRPPESISNSYLKKPWDSIWVDQTAVYDLQLYLVPRFAKVQLYHIESDPYEKHDVSALFPTIVTELLHKLVGYNATAVPARFPPADKQADPKYHGGYWGPWVQ